MGKIKESLFKSTEEIISTDNLLDKVDKVLVCVSGGADSIALMHILVSLQKKLNITIGVAHLNHQLRGAESERDALFVKTIVEQMAIPLHMENQNVKKYQQENRLSLEDAARHVRYSFFNKIAQKEDYNKIATAHTSNDNAELILMNLFRGSGPSGLSGIPVKRGKIIRPFLKVSRKSIISYLDDNSIDYVSDSSNASRVFLRNKVRLDLLPLIKKNYNENIIECLNRTSRILKEEESWINDMIIPLFDQTVIDKKNHSITLSVPQLNLLPVAAKRRVIRKAIGYIKGDLKKITLFHTDIIADMSDKQKPVLSADFPDRVQVKKQSGKLFFKRHDTNLRDLAKNNFSYTYQLHELKTHATTISLPAISMKMIFSFQDINDIDYSDQTIAWIDYNCLKFPLTIRNYRPDDRFTPLGMTGSQPLKKFFSGIAVSGEDKIICPLLLSENNIIWVGGHRVDNRYRLRPETKKILKVELLLD